MSQISVSQAAICRDLIEGGDGTGYLGSTTGFDGWIIRCMNYGLIERIDGQNWFQPTINALAVELKLTKLGQQLGNLCSEIPKGRAYAHATEYKNAIINFCIQNPDF